MIHVKGASLADIYRRGTRHSVTRSYSCCNTWQRFEASVSRVEATTRHATARRCGDPRNDTAGPST